MSRKCLGSEVPMCEHGGSPPETGKLGKLIKGNQGQKLESPTREEEGVSQNVNKRLFYFK